MRYYSIRITEPGTGREIRTYTSFVNGRTIAGALNIELDISTIPFAVPVGQAYVRIWGVGLQEIGQASDLNGKNIEVYGGMQRGLPLANPAQAGLLVSGTIFQAFGNWEGTFQALEMIFYPRIGSPESPRNIVVNWPAGQQLAVAVRNTLAVAFPSYQATINISPNLILPNTETGYFSTLTEFAQYVKLISASIINGPQDNFPDFPDAQPAQYGGVDISLKERAFTVYDGTTQKTPLALAFVDLIGQPTWLGTNQISFKTVMRADVGVGDYVKLPPGQVITTAQSLSRFRQGSIFQGVFFVSQVRHVGNFRSPDANNWVTAFQAALLPSSAVSQ